MNAPLTIVPSPISSTSRPQQAREGAPNQGAARFEALLNATLAGRQVRFSRHANERMQQRGLQMTGNQSRRLEQAMQDVASKGGRDSLVLLDQLALVVSVPNNTVVTVADRNNLQHNVFTNIDSAVIA